MNQNDFCGAKDGVGQTDVDVRETQVEKGRHGIFIQNHEPKSMLKRSRPVGASVLTGVESRSSYETTRSNSEENQTTNTMEFSKRRPNYEHFGFPVNGFHPQWPASTDILLPNTSAFRPELLPSPSFVEDRLNAKIAELIGRIRHEEEQTSLRRKKELDACDSNHINNPHKKARRMDDTRNLDAAIMGKKPADSCSCSDITDFSDLYSDVFINSNVAQLIATPGGRVIAWNDKFLDITGLLPNQVCSSLTVFNLIQANMLPKLFDLFSLALRGGSPSPLILRSPFVSMHCGESQRVQLTPLNKTPSLVSDSDDSPRSDVSSSSTDGGHDADVEDESHTDTSDEESEDTDMENTTHASMTLPCVQFSSNDTQLFITITLMNDIDPEKRCFHCVFAPAPHPTAETFEDEENTKEDIGLPKEEMMGEIRRISHKSLASLL